MKAIVFTVLLALSFAVTLAVEAQQPTHVPHIGVLLSIPTPERFYEPFREGLREFGTLGREGGPRPGSGRLLLCLWTWAYCQLCSVDVVGPP